MKTIIIYESTHHKNTYKLVKAIADKHCVKAVNLEEAKDIDLNEFELIGLASGIAFGSFYKKISEYAKKFLPENKKVFLIYTCGKPSEKYTSSIKKTVYAKKCKILGSFSCKGYDTFGPFRLIGGINKNHPTDKEAEIASEFYEKLITK